jgi:hypothetical protein
MSPLPAKGRFPRSDARHHSEIGIHARPPTFSPKRSRAVLLPSVS